MAYIFGSNLKNIKLHRAAVVPYTLNNGKLEMMFGIYNEESAKLKLSHPLEYKEITDLGGSIKTRENPLDAAFRELQEESKGIFGNLLDINYLSTCVSVAKPDNINNKGMCVIFAPVDKEWVERSHSLFNITPISDVPNSGTDEILELKWINEYNFELMLSSEHPIEEGVILWEKLRRFYKSIFSSYLKELLIARWYWKSFQEYSIKILPDHNEV